MPKRTFSLGLFKVRTSTPGLTWALQATCINITNMKFNVDEGARENRGLLNVKCSLELETLIKLIFRLY